MALTFNLKSNNQAFPGDGFLGVHSGGADYLIGGWNAIGRQRSTVYKSTDGGVTWVQQPDFYQAAHCMASAIKNDILYIVGGDVENGQNSLAYQFDSGTFTEIVEDCGINNRVLGGMAQLNGDFYYVGGQVGLEINQGIFNTVLKSTDNCQSFSVIKADTKPQFKGGLLWGGIVAYKGLLWKICGGLFDTLPTIRTYDTQVFSSPDGITWTSRGMFKGVGRHFHQCIVYKGRIYLFGGFNSYYGNNLDDIWSMGYSNGKVDWRYEGTAPWGTAHALSVWNSGDSLLMFGGSANPDNIEMQQCWQII